MVWSRPSVQRTLTRKGRRPSGSGSLAARCRKLFVSPRATLVRLSGRTVGASGYGARVSLDWPRALAWRMRQQLLDPVGTESVAGVVRRLGAIPAQLDAAAELAVRARRERSRSGEVARALTEGRIIKTFAFRGATHLMTPEDGGSYLALRAASRMWELPSWQSYYGLKPSDWPFLREAVREALADGPMTRDELGAAVTARHRFRHLGFAFADQARTLLKPLAWQGDMSFGPPRDGHPTFQRLDSNPRWAGLPDLDEAGTRAVEAYFRAYGPATPDHLRYWLGEGLGAGRKRIQSWMAGFGDRLAPVDVDGESTYVLREDLEELTAATATTATRLLPGYDQWVLGPGTADAHVVPPTRRTLVSRGAGIAVVGGVVSGTWSLTNDQVVIDWFAEAAPPARDAVAEEVSRLADILDRPMQSTIRMV